MSISRRERHTGPSTARVIFAFLAAPIYIPIMVVKDKLAQRRLAKAIKNAPKPMPRLCPTHWCIMPENHGGQCRSHHDDYTFED